MGILSYPAPITNSEYYNLSNLDVRLVEYAFAEHEDFDEKEFKDEHEEDDREKDENEKVKLCHFPEGQDDNPVTIEIDRSAIRPHLNHGDFFGGCEQFGIPEHDKEDKEDRDHDEEREHDVPDDIKEQMGIVLEKFTPEELEEIMEKEGPRGTASIIAEHTDLSFREAQKLVDFVMKEMADEQDREHDKEKEHDRDYDEDHEFPEHLEENARIVMEAFSEEEIMALMDKGPEAMVNAIVEHTDLTEEEAKEIVEYAMKNMEKPHDREDRDEMQDHERDDGEDDFIGGIMKGEYPTDDYVDSLLGGITSGGESIGGWFGGESDEVRDEAEFDEPEDDMFEGLFGMFDGEEEMKEDVDDDVREFEDDFEDDFDEAPRDVISHETEEKLNELENRLAERDRELEQAQDTIVELEDRLVELEKRFDLIMELLANQ